MADHDLNQVRVVLIDTTHPGNIGAAARAMKNMGLSSLYLVKPREFPSERASDRAVTATDLLEQATVVASLEEAIADCGLVIGTSARERRIPWPVLDPRACGERVVTEMAHHPVALLFGREARGMTNDELHRCHFHVHIPTSDAYPSLNLGMAVQVISYEIRQAWLASRRETARDAPWDVDYATSGDVERMIAHLQETMVKLDFHDPDNPRQLMTRVRRMLQRVRLDKMEVNIVRGVLHSIDRKLR